MACRLSGRGGRGEHGGRYTGLGRGGLGGRGAIFSGRDRGGGNRGAGGRGKKSPATKAAGKQLTRLRWRPSC